MARQRVVTRSIEDCIVEVTAMVTIDGKKTLAEETLHLGGQVSEEKALTVAQKMHNTDTFKVVEVNKFYKKMTIYGMKETDFIKLAQPFSRLSQMFFLPEEGADLLQKRAPILTGKEFLIDQFSLVITNFPSAISDVF